MGGGVTQSGFAKMLLESKKERDKEKQEKLAKKLSKVNVPRRTQPPRNAAAVAAAVMSDYDSSSGDSDLDSFGSAASYDPDHELYTSVEDSDFTEGLVGEDRRTYRKIIRRKKCFWIKQGRQQFLYYKDVNHTIGLHKNAKL